MRSRTFLLAFVLAVSSLALPIVAHAGIPFFGPIIPSSYNVCPASWGMLLIVINNIISLLLTLAVVFVAPIMIAYAGFLFVVNPMNPGGKEKAKGILTNTIVGIVIALAGYLIVAAIMAVLYNPKAVGATWSSLITSGGVPPCLKQSGALPTDTLNQASMSGITTAPAATGVDEQTIRNRFSAAGVSINKPACPSTTASSCGGTSPSCTNVAGMKEATIQQMIAVKKSCGSGCSVTITGGTEPGHACGTNSHQNGYKVDLSLSSTALNNYLKKIDSKSARSGGEPGEIYLDSCRNNQYVLTSDHWDITILAYCSS